MYLRNIPNLERRRHYGTAKLAWLIDKVSQAHGWKPIWDRPSDALPEFAEGDHSVYTHPEALGVKLAKDMGLFSQQDWDELEVSGHGKDELERALQGGET